MGRPTWAAAPWSWWRLTRYVCSRSSSLGSTALLHRRSPLHNGLHCSARRPTGTHGPMPLLLTCANPSRSTMWTGMRRGERGREARWLRGFLGSVISNAWCILIVPFNLTVKHEAVFDLGSSGLAALDMGFIFWAAYWAWTIICISFFFDLFISTIW